MNAKEYYEKALNNDGFRGKKEFREGEEAISKDAQFSYYYALSVLHGRFKLGEKTISKDAYYSYLYALNVLKGRFEIGEKAISKSSRFSYWYALYILHGRFELGEKTIGTDEVYCKAYLNKFSIRSHFFPDSISQLEI